MLKPLILGRFGLAAMAGVPGLVPLHCESDRLSMLRPRL